MTSFLHYVIIVVIIVVILIFNMILTIFNLLFKISIERVQIIQILCKKNKYFSFDQTNKNKIVFKVKNMLMSTN